MQSSTCEVYRMNPDGSKGEHIRTDPAFPEGWDNPTKILPQKPKKEEESEMVKRKPIPEKAELQAAFLAHGGNIDRVAKHYEVVWVTAKKWLVEAGLLEEKTSPNEPPVTQQEPPTQEPEVGCPFDEPIPYRITEPDPDPLTAELTKLKLDFANLTLASALGDVAKLKVIEYIVRM